MTLEPIAGSISGAPQAHLMATQKITVTLKGKSPLLMHAFPLAPVEALEKKSPQEQAEYAAYRDADNDNVLYIPGINIQRARLYPAQPTGTSGLDRPNCDNGRLHFGPSPV